MYFTELTLQKFMLLRALLSEATMYSTDFY